MIPASSAHPHFKRPFPNIPIDRELIPERGQLFAKLPWGRSLIPDHDSYEKVL